MENIKHRGRVAKYDEDFLTNLVQNMNQETKPNLHSWLKAHGREDQYPQFYLKFRQHGWLKKKNLNRKQRKATKYPEELLLKVKNEISTGQDKFSLKKYLESHKLGNSYGSIYAALKRTGLINKINITHRNRAIATQSGGTISRRDNKQVKLVIQENKKLKDELNKMKQELLAKKSIKEKSNKK